MARSLNICLTHVELNAATSGKRKTCMHRTSEPLTNIEEVSALADLFFIFYFGGGGGGAQPKPELAPGHPFNPAHCNSYMNLSLFRGLIGCTDDVLMFEVEE